MEYLNSREMKFVRFRKENRDEKISRLAIGTYCLSGVYGDKDLAELGRLSKRKPVELAVAWVLSQPGIDCALAGHTAGSSQFDTFSAEELSPEDKFELFRDLVYALDTLQELTEVKEERILPVFRKLLELKANLESVDSRRLTAIREEIRLIYNQHLK